MDFINFHIAYLLTKHKQVIIPDFGAFVAFKVQDNQENRKGILSPPGKYSLIFNPEIIKDDGLLVHSIAKEKNISDGEALRLVYEYVDSLVDNLRAGQTVRFPWIGKIHLSGNRKIVFTPALNLSCNASGCGLDNFSFPYLNENPAAGKRKKNRRRTVVYIMIAVTVLLSVWGALITLKPFHFPMNLISLPHIPAPVSETLPVNSPGPAGVDSTASVAVDSVPAQPQYFLIIASLTKEKEAEDMLEHFISKGMDSATIVHSDGRYRISIETFTNKEDAVSFLDSIRKEQGNLLFSDAWILEKNN